MHAPDCELVTAIVTPFTADNKVDVPALEKLTQYLIDNGSDGILVNGSTGENPTVSLEEKLLVLNTVKKVIAGKHVKLIAGSSTNCTEETVELCKTHAAQGVDALLVVVPYYNKPSQEGMFAHYSAVAKAVPDTPIIIYNIPGRSVVNMLPQTMQRLAEAHGNIVGVKQSNADMDQVSLIRKLTPPSFRIWSGDDSLTIPMMGLGAYGCISVASHVIGSRMRDMIQSAKQGNTTRALELHLGHFEVYGELFFIPNPTVVKAALAKMGLIQPHLRLPLVAPSVEEARRIDKLVAQIRSLAPATA